ncbi:MAG: putative peptidoglycan glycosyltransferase FtsW [Gemmatimonadota bacterium]|nr:putative peptidoglycan glycosyltransferase FtsW [Gemmatimonadota bacterium]
MRQATLEWGLSPVQTSTGAPTWVRRGLLTITGALVLFGLLSVYSASSFAAQKAGLPDSFYLVGQLGRAAFGAIVLIALTFIDYDLYRRFAWPILAASAFLLVLVALPWTTDIAPPLNGARRWLVIGPVTFQPSEVAKVAIVVWVAALADRKQDRLGSFREGVLPFVIVLAPLLGLILIEPHLSATLIATCLAGTVLFAAGARFRHFAMLLGCLVPILGIVIRTNPYQLRRVLAFLDPAGDATGVGYQLEQARIAIGAGGAFGVGFGESSQKLQYLPEPQNDFIFPIIAEEWGFLGAGLVLIAFLLWTLLGLRIAASAPDVFGRLLAIGLTGIVAIGAFLHMGITMGMLPTTGVSLPFVSAGGTGIVVALGVTGVLLNIASKRRA